MSNFLRMQRDLDTILGGPRFRNIHRPRTGWIRVIRRSLGMTQSDLAKAMGINQSSVHTLEASEANMSIRLETLEAAAQALGCELVYALVPRRPLEQTYRLQARKMVQRRVRRVENNMALENQAVKIPKSEVESMVENLVQKAAVRWNEGE